MAKLIRYDNVKTHGGHFGPTYYDAIAVYDNGATQHVTMSEASYKCNLLVLELQAMGATKEMMEKVDELRDLMYREGLNDAEEQD